jgi:hypothetical protein
MSSTTGGLERFGGLEFWRSGSFGGLEDWRGLEVGTVCDLNVSSHTGSAD